MGKDIEAYIIVGLLASELDIEKVPGISRLDVYNSADTGKGIFSPDELVELKNSEPASDGSYYVRAIDVHSECDLDQICIGYVVAETESWDVKRINTGRLLKKITKKREAFRKDFGQKPKVYLVPREW